MNSGNAPLSIPLDTTFGAALLGTFFSLILCGGIAHQTVRYYQTYLNDIFLLKALVFSVVFVEGAHTALCVYSCYYLLVTGYSNLSTLQNIPLAIHVLPVLSGVIIVLSQAFFVRRAYLFGRQYRGWAVFVAILLLGEFGFSLASTIDSIRAPKTTGFVAHSWIVAVAAALAVAADWILTAILTVSLHKSRTGIKSTDSLTDVLVLYAITTGFLTSACMLVLFVFAVARPNDMIYVALSFVVTKLYTNTLLAALNTRKSLRDAAFNNPSGVEIFGVSGNGLLADRRRTAKGEPLRNGDATARVVVELSDMFPQCEFEGTKV